jgi:hypothetical protein
MNIEAPAIQPWPVQVKLIESPKRIVKMKVVNTALNLPKVGQKNAGNAPINK